MRAYAPVLAAAILAVALLALAFLFGRYEVVSTATHVYKLDRLTGETTFIALAEERAVFRRDPVLESAERKVRERTELLERQARAPARLAPLE